MRIDREAYQRVLRGIGAELRPQELGALEELVTRLQAGFFPSEEGTRLIEDVHPTVLAPSLAGWDAPGLEELGEIALETVGGYARAHVLFHEELAMEKSLIPQTFVPLAHIDGGACVLALGVASPYRGELILAHCDGQEQTLSAAEDAIAVGRLESI